MMEQIIFHLIGDYITQTNWMATEKTKRNFAALCHATVYSIPFLFLTDSLTAIFSILISHFFIDRFRLARYVVFAKNWITDTSLSWDDCNLTGYPSNTPMWLSFWLLIIVDNTLHITINYASLRWL